MQNAVPALLEKGRGVIDFEVVGARYCRSLSEGDELGGFLRRIPWALDMRQQDPAELLGTLRRECERCAGLSDGPVFSVVVSGLDTQEELLRETILSVRAQSWQRWEALLVLPPGRRTSAVQDPGAADDRIRRVDSAPQDCLAHGYNAAVEAASGDYLCFVEAGDLLHPQAFAVLARLCATDTTTNLFYSNQAWIDPAGGVIAHFLSKPDLDLFTLLRFCYVARLGALSRTLLLDASRTSEGVFCSRDEGCEVDGLFLRLALSRNLVTKHSPLFLYYKRGCSHGTAETLGGRVDLDHRRRKLLEELLPRYYGEKLCTVSPPNQAEFRLCWSIAPRFAKAEGGRTLLVVVPFRDEGAATVGCLERIEAQHTSLMVQVVLVDNRSKEPGTGKLLNAWLARSKRFDYVLERHDGPFSFARINNDAIARWGGQAEFVLLLNNDVELVSSDALEVMAAHLDADRRCAFVGIRLMHPPGDDVQHGGICVLPVLAGSGRFAVDNAQDGSRLVYDDHVVAGVTFACAMVRRSVWNELGGLEEVRMPNAFGDVDMCLRAMELGYHNHFFGTLVATHYTSRTRGRTDESFELQSLYERHAGALARWCVRSLAWESEPAPATLGQGRPLRHVVADRLNTALKRWLGSLHRVARPRLERYLRRQRD
ncbi:glycosyltransferase [Planctomycetota bacterium]